MNKKFAIVKRRYELKDKQEKREFSKLLFEHNEYEIGQIIADNLAESEEKLYKICNMQEEVDDFFAENKTHIEAVKACAIYDVKEYVCYAAYELNALTEDDAEDEAEALDDEEAKICYKNYGVDLFDGKYYILDLSECKKSELKFEDDAPCASSEGLKDESALVAYLENIGYEIVPSGNYRIKIDDNYHNVNYIYDIKHIYVFEGLTDYTDVPEKFKIIGRYADAEISIFGEAGGCEECLSGWYKLYKYNDIIILVDGE